MCQAPWWALGIGKTQASFPLVFVVYDPTLSDPFITLASNSAPVPQSQSLLIINPTTTTPPLKHNTVFQKNPIIPF